MCFFYTEIVTVNFPLMSDEIGSGKDGGGGHKSLCLVSIFHPYSIYID